MAPFIESVLQQAKGDLAEALSPERIEQEERHLLRLRQQLGKLDPLILDELGGLPDASEAQSIAWQDVPRLVCPLSDPRRVNPPDGRAPSL
jgi:hypothetical protein